MRFIYEDSIGSFDRSVISTQLAFQKLVVRNKSEYHLAFYFKGKFESPSSLMIV